MKAKLIKTGSDYLLRDMNGEVLAITNGTTEGRKLSTKNCDEIFGVVDVEKLAEECSIDWNGEVMEGSCGIYKEGFNKAMELNKDKVFTEEDMNNAMDWIMTQYFEFHEQPTTGRREQYLQSLQQPSEIEVIFNPEEKDSEGCLILKKI
jgi:fructose/tagatose bisphosphate aldolase